MTDRLDGIKLRAEWAPAAEPPDGQEDLFWLIQEVDRLRGQVLAITDHVRIITSSYEQHPHSEGCGFSPQPPADLRAPTVQRRTVGAWMQPPK